MGTLKRQAQSRLGNTVDVQAQLSLERVEATVALIEGEPAAAFETGVRHFEETPFAQGISVWMAVLGAALLGDLERLHRAREMAEALPPGVFNSPSLRWAEAMVELAGGDVAEGSTHAETLVGWMRERSLVWRELLTLTTTARMLPPDHEARARYRRRIEELTVPAGALGLWEWARSLIDDTD